LDDDTRGYVTKVENKGIDKNIYFIYDIENSEDVNDLKIEEVTSNEIKLIVNEPKPKYNLNDIVRLRDNKIGEIKYIGSVNFGNGLHYGIELLDGNNGDNNGIVNGKEYFKLNNFNGIFVHPWILNGKTRKPNVNDIKLYDTCWVESQRKIWRECYVIKKNFDEYLIHYIGFHNDYNEWIDRDSKRISKIRPNGNKLNIGDSLSVYSMKVNMWCEGEIIDLDINRDLVRILFIGTKFTEWIYNKSTRLSIKHLPSNAPFGSINNSNNNNATSGGYVYNDYNNNNNDIESGNEQTRSLLNNNNDNNQSQCIIL